MSAVEPTVVSGRENDNPETKGGMTLDSVLDVPSLQAEIDRNARINRNTMKPYRQYQKRVIEKAGVQNTQPVRELTSNICGAVARLPFVPDDKEVIETRGAIKMTEFDLQVERTAAGAENQLGSEVVWTTTARRLSKAALELRRQDPDGSKKIAWVNELRVDDAYVLDE